MSTEDQSKLDRLKTALYSRTGYVPDDPVKPLTKEEYTAPRTWQDIPELPVRPGIPFIKIVIWFSVIFFLCAAGTATYLFYTGYNTISASNVNLMVSGPTTLAGGEPLSLNVKIENRNTTTMENAYLVVNYPEGARKTIDSFEPLIRERIPLDTLASGAVTSKAIQAVFFGVEGTPQKITLSVQYTVADSAGMFEKAGEYNFTLGPAPIAVAMTYPKEVSSGQTVELELEISSNTTQPLGNIALQMNYPVGFTFTKATPAPDTDTNTWTIGTLQPGEKRKISITGRLDGPENEVRGFRYTIGSSDPNNRRVIATAYKTEAKDVTLQRPFIAFNLALDGDTSDIHFIESGGPVSANLMIINNLDEQINDAVIEVQINGAYLDKSSIEAGQGFYQTKTNTLSWDKRQISALRSLTPEQQASVQFNFETIPFSQSRSAQVNQPIIITVTARGNRASNQNNPEQVSASISRQVKFLSEVSFSGEAVYSAGPFTNQGPLPPRAEQETTYTVIWTIYNTYNPLANAKISATLPPYARFMGTKSPTNESLTYNQSSGEIVWSPGTIPANTGYGSVPRQVAFQVAITPSRTQVGSAPALIGQANFSAVDTVTKKDVSAREVPLTTQLPTDPRYKPSQAVVAQ